MKIKQIKVSYSVKSFKPRMIEKYKLVEYSNQNEPSIFFGVYNDTDYSFLENHNSYGIIVWCGTDAQNIGKFKQNLHLIKKSPLEVSTEASKFLRFK